MDRHEEQTKHSQRLAGEIAATIANFSMGAQKEPLRPFHFFPLLTPEPEKPKRLNRRKIAEGVRQMMDGLMNAAAPQK